MCVIILGPIISLINSFHSLVCNLLVLFYRSSKLPALLGYDSFWARLKYYPRSSEPLALKNLRTFISAEYRWLYFKNLGGRRYSWEWWPPRQDIKEPLSDLWARRREHFSDLEPNFLTIPFRVKSAQIFTANFGPPPPKTEPPKKGRRVVEKCRTICLTVFDGF